MQLNHMSVPPGIREYSSMSSQVPTTTGGISDIAFESGYPYSLHPTATNGSINVGDRCYSSTYEVSITATGGSYDLDADCGSLAFRVSNSLDNRQGYLGSSGIRE